MCVHMCGGACVCTVLHVCMVARSLCHIFFALFLSLYWGHVFHLTLDHFSLATLGSSLWNSHLCPLCWDYRQIYMPCRCLHFFWESKLRSWSLQYRCFTHWVISLLHQVIVLEIISHIYATHWHTPMNVTLGFYCEERRINGKSLHVWSMFAALVDTQNS